MTLVLGPFSLSKLSSSPTAWILPLEMAMAVTLAGVVDWSSADKWLPVSILPLIYMALGEVWARVAVVASRKALMIKGFTWGV